MWSNRLLTLKQNLIIEVFIETMLHRLLNEAFSKHKILALCSHFFFVSVFLKHLILGALVDGRGAPGGCSNG